VQVLADPAGRLVWISPTLPGARHDIGAAREHGIIDALNAVGIDTVADTAYQGGGPVVRTRNGDAGLIPTPAATGACQTTRRPSTPHTPASAVRASGSMRS
jgi:hypothetical protein